MLVGLSKAKPNNVYVLHLPPITIFAMIAFNVGLHEFSPTYPWPMQTGYTQF